MARQWIPETTTDSRPQARTIRVVPDSTDDAPREMRPAVPAARRPIPVTAEITEPLGA